MGTALIGDVGALLADPTTVLVPVQLFHAIVVTLFFLYVYTSIQS